MIFTDHVPVNHLIAQYKRIGTEIGKDQLIPVDPSFFPRVEALLDGYLKDNRRLSLEISRRRLNETDYQDKIMDRLREVLFG